jgi:hypothetical protein
MFLGPLFLKTHSVCSFFKMRDKVVHLCPTRGRYTVVYFLHVIYWNSRWEDKILHYMVTNSPFTDSFVICYCYLQIFELSDIFKELFGYADVFCPTCCWWTWSYTQFPQQLLLGHSP